jgi:hypothetical protein
LCRYTWEEVGAKEVATVGKETKLGMTVMVAHDAAGNMMNYLVITKGGTVSSLDKFVIDNEGFKGALVEGGVTRGKGTARYMRTKPKKGSGETVKVAELPPFIQNMNGDVLACGDDNHWMKLPSLKLWVARVVWPKHQRECSAKGLDPQIAKGIIHIDAYPVHISADFIKWVKDTYPMLLLISVPCNFTSKTQIADVALNRHLKAAYVAAHMAHLTS